MSDTTFLKQAPILAISPFLWGKFEPHLSAKVLKTQPPPPPSPLSPYMKEGGSNYDQMTGFFITQVFRNF